MIDLATPPKAEEIQTKAISRRCTLAFLLSIGHLGLGSQPIRAASAGSPVTIWARESLYHPSGSAYFMHESQWGTDSLANVGPDGPIIDPAHQYIDKMMGDPANFPNNTVCQFQYPSSSSGVYSYPNVTYGRNQYNNPPSFSAAPTSARIANLTELIVDYNITADDRGGGRFAVIHDIWLNSIANAGLNDRMFEIDFACFVQRGMGFGGKYVFTVADTGAWDGQSVHSLTYNWRVLAAHMNVNAGKANVLGLFKQMMWYGLATGNEWIMGTTMGPEPYGGAGTVTIRTYSVTWSAADNITIPPRGTYAVGSRGSNHIVGAGAGQGCSVAYPNAASTYQVRRILQNILVRADMENLTLDVLQGIDYLHFSDGTKITADMPLVSDCILALGTPISAGMVVGTIRALGGPTTWSITKGDPSNYFAISSFGQLSVTSAGANGGILIGVDRPGVITLEVQAVNASGSDVGIVKVGRVIFTTLDAASKSASISLSGGNLVATSASASPDGDIARATDTELFGKYYCEATVTWLDGAGSWALGLVNSNETLSNTAIGSTANSIGAYADASGGVIKTNNVATAEKLGGNAGNGDVIGMAVDLDNQRIWFRLNDGNWNDDASADPSVSTGGIDISGVQQFKGANYSGPRLSPAVYLKKSTVGASATLNFGQSPFSFLMPKGFGPLLHGI